MACLQQSILLFCTHWLLRITSRTIMALMVITVRCGYWLVEQPGSSQLIHHPEMCYFLSLLEKSGLNFEFTRLPPS